MQPGSMKQSAFTSVMILLAIFVLASTTGLVEPEQEDDTLFLVPDPSKPDLVHVVITNASRLVVHPSSALRLVTILNAPRMREIEGTSDLQILNVGGCLLERLEDSLARLSGVRTLRFMCCQLKGTLDLALLFATPALVSLSLEGNQFERVVRTQDPEQPHVLELLDLSGNALEHFNWSVLEPFTKLNKLLLCRNRLISLTGEVRLPNLCVLSLRENRLIRADLTGCDCAALSQVQFARNGMVNWPTFAPSSTALRSLELSDNHLSAVNYTELAQHRSLSSLQLNRNAISSLEPTEAVGDNETSLELPNLVSLFLQENRLEVLQLDRWKLPMLRMLSVVLNPLKSLPTNLFLRWPKLYYFYCYCPAIECVWIEQHRSYLAQRSVQMSTWRAQGSKKDPTEQSVMMMRFFPIVCISFAGSPGTTSPELTDSSAR
uniref:Leucine rich immune protein (Coil-less) n=1 Tax=Anopheles atroparvus TaxID=41427 RepID=A0A182IJT6_ANOAO